MRSSESADPQDARHVHLLAPEAGRQPGDERHDEHVGQHVAVTTHVISSIVTPNVPLICGRATLTILASRAAMIVPVMTVPAMTHLFGAIGHVGAECHRAAVWSTGSSRTGLSFKESDSSKSLSASSSA